MNKEIAMHRAKKQALIKLREGLFHPHSVYKEGKYRLKRKDYNPITYWHVIIHSGRVHKAIVNPIHAATWTQLGAVKGYPAHVYFLNYWHAVAYSRMVKQINEEYKNVR